MSFPWMTEAQRRKQRQDEDFARRAVAELAIRLNCGRGIKPALTDTETQG